MQIEDDPRRKQQIFDTYSEFRKKVTCSVYDRNTFLQRNCYRRKIDGKKEMILLVYLGSRRRRKRLIVG